MRYLQFWMLPLVSAAMWVSMLVAMLGKWISDGSPHYPSMAPTQHLAYISDVGAQYLKPLFIGGSVVTVVTLDAAILGERWLRHRGFLVANNTKSEKVLAWLAIAFSILGGAGLILLSIFDTLRHPKLHDGFLLLFLGGYILTAIFTCAEYQRLGRKLRQHRVLRISFWIKLVFILCAIVLAAAFVGLTFTGHQQQGAYVEWIIALIFTAWVLSFVIDLLPAARAHHHSGKGLRHGMTMRVRDEESVES